MNVLLFGVSNVGKSAIGKRLSQLLEYDFYDLDNEITKEYNMTLTDFLNIYVDDYNRHKRKIDLLNKLIKKSENSVIAVSPINYKELLKPYLNRRNILPIVLKDTPQHIFDRLIFSDEFDNVYIDNEYKNKHKQYYLDEILQDIYVYHNIYQDIKSDFFIDNRSIEQSATILCDLIKNNKPIKYAVDIDDILYEMISTTSECACMYDTVSGRKIYISLNNLYPASYNDIMDLVLNDDIYIQLPTLEDLLSFNFYEDYLNELSDEAIKNDLLQKYDDVNRDFQEDLDEYGLLDNWLQYEYNKNLDFAKNWCKANNIDYEIRSVFEKQHLSSNL